MPTKTTKKIVRRKKTSNIASTAIVSEVLQNNPAKFVMNKQIKIGIFVVLILVLGYFAWSKGKGMVLAGSVNGGLISRFELNSRINSQFGKQMLEVLIGEKLITDEASKRNITVSSKEIDDKIKELEDTLGQGLTLDAMLEQRGMTKSDLLNQVKLQLTIDKMFSKDISISAKEIEDYVKTNETYLTASGSAEKLIEAEKQVKSTKIEEKFTEWFTKVRGEAKILRFL